MQPTPMSPAMKMFIPKKCFSPIAPQIRHKPARDKMNLSCLLSIFLSFLFCRNAGLGILLQTRNITNIPTSPPTITRENLSRNPGMDSRKGYISQPRIYVLIDCGA